MRTWRIVMELFDTKRYIIARERGRNGYEHWQARLEMSGRGFFEWCKDALPKMHIEKATDNWEYERKEGHYVTDQDTVEILKQRYGTPTEAQERVLQAVRATNDRQVVVWYDSTGGVGKSWLTGHLWERAAACVVPATVNEPKAIVQYVHSAYKGEGLIIIDIPRSSKWSQGLYEAIETIKDGLVYDTRYAGRMRNIRGVKVLVMTNTMPRLDRLSQDRWIIIQSALAGAHKEKEEEGGAGLSA